MRGRNFSFILLFFLILFSILSLAFKVDVSPGDRRIMLNETAEFDLSIKHSYQDPEVFEVYSPDIFWNIRTQDVLRVPGRDVFNTKLLIRPLNINPGIYSVPLIFRQTSIDEKVEDRIIIEIISPYSYSGNYLPAVRGTPQLKKDIDPREPYEIAISLENKNMKNLSNVEIRVRSNVINKDYVTSLGPLKQKKVKFTVNLDPFTKPQEDVLYITVLASEGDKIYQFDLFPAPIRIIHFGYIEKNISVSKSFLKTTTHIHLLNNGNGDDPYNYSIKAGFFKSLFIQSVPDMTSKGDDLEWNVVVSSKKEMELFVEVNYRPLFWFIVVIFALILFYFMFRSPIAIKKSARVIRTREGGISDIKIILEVIHRGYRKIKDFEIIDLVPKIAEFINEKSTTIEPTSITKSESKGTLVKWQIGKVEPKDHRIITYSVRSKLSILGGLKLPVAVAKFKTEHREREVTSNSVNIKFIAERE